MNPVQNPHDKFFKALMSDIPAAVKFLSEFLPHVIVKQLDLNKLHLMESSFVTDELSEIFADIIFRVPLADSSGEEYIFVSILIEHKSFPDDLILLQVGQYLFKGYQEQIHSKDKQLELIIPLVYYHGKRRWELPALSDLFPSYSDSLQAFIPSLKIEFQDIGLKSDNAILEMDPIFLATVL